MVVASDYGGPVELLERNFIRHGWGRRVDLQLAGRTAVVTGAGRGIGLAITEVLADEGVTVLGAARTITAELEATGAAVLAVDLATPDGPRRLAHHAVAALGGVDILVNNVGGAERFIAFDDLTDSDWQHALDWNLLSAVRLTHALVGNLRERGAAVVNVSTTGARMPSGPMPYTAAKAALTAWSKAMAEELGPAGVRVNTVSPGVTRTQVWAGPDGVGAQLAQAADMNQNDFLATVVPDQFGITIGRLVEPDEVAAAVAWLVSPRAAAVCGADIVVDGGSIKTI